MTFALLRALRRLIRKPSRAHYSNRHKVLVAHIAAAVKELPEPWQTAFLLRVRDGYSLTIIAEKLDLTPAEVEEYLVTSLIAVARSSSEETPDDPMEQTGLPE